MKVARLYRVGSGKQYIFYDMRDKDLQDSLVEEVEMSEVGDELRIKIIDMPEQKYEAMPEFDGW